LAVLARKAARWAKDNLFDLGHARPEAPDELNDRAADAWESLLAIADKAGTDWPDRARYSALALMGAKDDEAEPKGIRLLSDMHELFETGRNKELFTKEEILPYLHDREDRPWAEYNNGRPITPTQLASLLKEFGIPTNKNVRRGSRTCKGYKAAWFEDVWARYLPPGAAVTRSQSSDSAAPGDPGAVTGDAQPVTSAGTAAVTPGESVTDDVTDES
jgi:hypothetical protein